MYPSDTPVRQGDVSSPVSNGPPVRARPLSPTTRHSDCVVPNEQPALRRVCVATVDCGMASAHHARAIPTTCLVSQKSVLFVLANRGRMRRVSGGMMLAGYPSPSSRTKSRFVGRTCYGEQSMIEAGSCTLGDKECFVVVYLH